jgi:hypothetical protein
MKIGAVLTADIVNSSLLPPHDLEGLSEAIMLLLQDCIPKVHFYRGDGFNALVTPHEALLVAARLRTFTRSYRPRGIKEPIDIRIAVGIGPVEEPVLSMASGKGEAFILSGRELDSMTNSDRRLVIRCYDKKAELGFTAIDIFSDYIISKLSTQQAMVVFELLKGTSEKETAKHLKKAQPTVNKLKKAALWDELEQILKLYQELVQTLQPEI